MSKQAVEIHNFTSEFGTRQVGEGDPSCNHSVIMLFFVSRPTRVVCCSRVACLGGSPSFSRRFLTREPGQSMRNQ
jgi:hypothetical protein